MKQRRSYRKTSQARPTKALFGTLCLSELFIICKKNEQVLNTCIQGVELYEILKKAAFLGRK